MAASPEALPLGTELYGYRITRFLGEGGFAFTYLVENALGQTFAMKELFISDWMRRVDGKLVLKPGVEPQWFSSQYDRFVKSSKTLCALSHPNIVRVVNFFYGQNTAYLVMEYIDGAALDQWVDERGGAITRMADLRRLFGPILDALEAVHRADILHRDIKPQNIMIERATGRPVLIDFGTLKEGTDAARSTSSMVVFSEFYSPPEQDNTNDRHLPATDIFALAGTMYRVVTGRRPPSPKARDSSTNPVPYVPVAEAARAPLDPALMAAIDKALSIRIDDRYPTIAAMRSALGWDRPEDTGHTTPQPPPPPPPPPPSRWPLAAALVLGLLGGGAAMAMMRPAPDTTMAARVTTLEREAGTLREGVKAAEERAATADQRYRQEVADRMRERDQLRREVEAAGTRTAADIARDRDAARRERDEARTALAAATAERDRVTRTADDRVAAARAEGRTQGQTEGRTEARTQAEVELRAMDTSLRREVQQRLQLEAEMTPMRIELEALRRRPAALDPTAFVPRAELDTLRQRMAEAENARRSMETDLATLRSQSSDYDARGQACQRDLDALRRSCVAGGTGGTGGSGSGGSSTFQPPPPPRPRVPNGTYTATRGYFTASGSTCLAQYPEFNVSVSNGTIRFVSDVFTWTGSINQQTGVIDIPWDGIINFNGNRAVSRLSISGPADNARIDSGSCGAGWFRMRY